MASTLYMPTHLVPSIPMAPTPPPTPSRINMKRYQKSSRFRDSRLRKGSRSSFPDRKRMPYSVPSFSNKSSRDNEPENTTHFERPAARDSGLSGASDTSIDQLADLETMTVQSSLCQTLYPEDDEKVEDGLHYTKHSGNILHEEHSHSFHQHDSRQNNGQPHGDHQHGTSHPIPSFMESIDSNAPNVGSPATASLFTDQFDHLEHLNVVHSDTEEPIPASAQAALSQHLFYRQRSISMPDLPPSPLPPVHDNAPLHSTHDWSTTQRKVPVYRIQRSTSMQENHQRKVLETRADPVDLPLGPRPFPRRQATDDLPPIPGFQTRLQIKYSQSENKHVFGSQHKARPDFGSQQSSPLIMELDGLPGLGFDTVIQSPIQFNFVRSKAQKGKTEHHDHEY